MQPALTSEKFFVEDMKRVYLTKDLGYQRPEDKCLMHLGRALRKRW
jgi:hypothetical protein